MYHLLHQVRPAVDAFETWLVNAFTPVGSVEAIWVREVPGIDGRYTRMVWVQLGRLSSTDLRQVKTLGEEIVVRTHGAPFDVEIRALVDELPPSAIAPSCIYRRGSGRV